MAANSSPPRPFYKIKNKPTRFTNRLYTYKANNHKASIMEDLNKELRPLILMDDAIIHANPGIYTWIIKGDREQRHFYATRVFSEQEIGTLHQDIHRQTGSGSSPLCAGELEIELGKPITFNIQSGTFTRDINKFYPRKDMALVMQPELYDDIQRDALELYKSIPRNESSPNSVSLEEIEKIIGMRRPEAQPIKRRIRRRIDLYKRNRMVAAVEEMLCSFFGINNKCEEVIFLKGGNDDDYIKNGTLGQHAEVLAGKSLLSKEIITSNENRNRLNRIFKVNTRKRNHS